VLAFLFTTAGASLAFGGSDSQAIYRVIDYVFNFG